MFGHGVIIIQSRTVTEAPRIIIRRNKLRIVLLTFVQVHLHPVYKSIRRLTFQVGTAAEEFANDPQLAVVVKELCRQ